jgi:hypothetical protein
MKAMVRETEGYSEDMLISMLRGTSFPSAFFDQPAPVRGVCFTGSPDSAKLARNFAEGRLRLGILSVGSGPSIATAWRELRRILAHPQTQFSRVGVLLPQLDQTPPEVQKQIAETILATDKLLWFPSANDLRKLNPTLKLALVVYLGLGSDNRMKILIQPGQLLQIDRGSLKRAPRPTLN